MFPSMWNGDVPKKATHKKLVKFTEESNNFPHSAATVKIPEFPKLEEFKEQAIKARS